MKKISTVFFRKKLKIAIIGGCQAEGLKISTEALLPNATVFSWHVGVSPGDSPELILEKLRTFDWVLTQITPGPGLETLQFDLLKRELKQVFFVPTVVFSGFHPDMAYIFSQGGVISAVHSDFHSKIAVAGFLLGLDEKRTQALYNAVVFAELGYFDAFHASRVAMEQTFSEAGLDISEAFDEWLRDIGAFMYMVNHPNVALLTILARQMYVQMGLLSAQSRVPKIEKDHLGESFCWPIYPPLAKRFGVKGSWNFQRPAWLVAPGQRDLSIEQYLQDLFTYYRTLDPEVLATEDIIDARNKIGALMQAAA
jgi:hypothetical protein